MIKRSAIVIDPTKEKEFTQFVNSSAKNERYWENVRKGASIKVDKRELNKLFEKKR